MADDSPKDATPRAKSKTVTTTRSGNTVTRDAKRVGPNGGTTESHSVRTKDGDKVTTQTTRTHTGPDGSGHRKHRAHHPNTAESGQSDAAPKR